MKTAREIIKHLIDSVDDLDQPVTVRIVRRDTEGSVRKASEAHISYFRFVEGNNICVEEDQIYTEGR